jgi:hypothetical protein
MLFSCRRNTADPQAVDNIVQALTKLLVGEKSKPVWYLPRAAKSSTDSGL